MQEWKEKIMEAKKLDIEKLTKQIEYLESISKDTDNYTFNNTSNALFRRHSSFLKSGVKNAKVHLVNLKNAYLKFSTTDINNATKLHDELAFMHRYIWLGNKSCDGAEKETDILFQFQTSESKNA